MSDKKASTWQDLENDLLAKGHITIEDIAESQARADIICALINARKENKMSQRKLEELTGVRTATIQRVENGQNSPSVDTMLKILAPMGMTLAVIPLEQGK
jgi:DNA-binding XRE family transcriptional regulator